jgi:SAM-dependent methyltransferase
MKDTDFYNKESATYSAKRYPAKAATFTQFFFKERLRLTLGLLEKYVQEKREVSLLEIGCADGVVARAIWQKFGQNIAAFDATDIAPDMIEAAKKNNADTPIRFSVREGISLPARHDCIIEVGVLNYLDLEEELDAVASVLAPGDAYVCSLVGRSSLLNTFKGKGDGLLHLNSYRGYESEIRKRFEIQKTVATGFFIPWLWKLPAVARALQPIIEKMLAFMPGLAHEKIYVLISKN